MRVGEHGNHTGLVHGVFNKEMFVFFVGNPTRQCVAVRLLLLNAVGVRMNSQRVTVGLAIEERVVNELVFRQYPGQN